MPMQFVDPEPLDDSHTMTYCQNCWNVFPERQLEIIAGQRICPNCKSTQDSKDDKPGSEPTTGSETKSNVEPQDVPHDADVEPDGRNNSGKDTTDHGGQIGSQGQEVEADKIAKVKSQRRARDND